jgi:flagellar protein FliT
MSPKHATLQHTALPQYRAIEQTSARMATAALLNNWAEVARLEAMARDQVAALQPLLGTAALSRDEKRARLAALKAVLRHDAQVRALAEPGWLQVQPWVGL